MFALLFQCGILLSQSGSQTFTSSGVFTVPASVTSITIEVVGAGGSGGSNGGGGGGGGGYALGTYTVVPLTTINIIVGTGGGSPSAGTTSAGTLISATGGANGTSVPNPNLGGGGAGGAGTGGTSANRTGGTGGGGYWTYFGGGGAGAAGSSTNGSNGGNTILWTGNCVTPGGAAGNGGGAPGGNGGKGAGFTDVNCNITDPAAGGVNYGGGGGGGNGNGGVPGVGAGGYCLISWGPTSVNNSTTSSNVISVSKNPFTDFIHLENTLGTEIFSLINVAGQLVWSGMEIKKNDFSGLAPGVYFLQVDTGVAFQTIRLVKE